MSQICTMVVWCGSAKDGVASAHYYDEEGCYVSSVKVSASLCNGSKDVVIYNVGLAVHNPFSSSGPGPATAMPNRDVVTQFERTVVSGRPLPFDDGSRVLAERSWRSGRALQFRIPASALSPQAAAALRTASRAVATKGVNGL